MSDQGEFSRRDFIKTVALTGAVAAAAGAVGPLTASPAAAQGPTKYAWETPPAPIPAAQIKETVTCDVVVIGAGVGGLTATLAAAQSGAKVVELEKGETFGARGGDNGVLGSKLQKELGIVIDKDEILEEIVRYGANKVDIRIVRLWLDRSGETMDWLIDLATAAGQKVTIAQWPRPLVIKNEFYRTWPTAHNFEGSQPGLAKLIEGAAKKAGADIRYKTPAVQLIRQDKGRVTGVVAKNDKGDYVQFNAKNAVVLATGDYSNDAEMMQKYCAWAVGIPNIYTPKTNTGDGQKMGAWVGGVIEDGPHAPMIHCLGAFGGEHCYMKVNILGERFQNEDVPNMYNSNAVLTQPGRTYWTVFASDWADYAWKMGSGLGRTVVVTDANRTSLENGVKAGSILQADTIQALAEKMKVPVETFKATVARYNTLAKQGKDLDFGKRWDRLYPIEKPPFYASKGSPSVLVVLGGLKINPKLQVLDAERKVIPGLYAAGNVSGGFYAVDYPMVGQGLSHGRCLTFGRLAGLAAAADKPA